MAAPVRLMVTDVAWQAIVIELDRGNHTAGCPPPRDRRVMEAVCAVVRRGLPGREWPKAFGTGDAMSSQVCRGEKRRVWRRLWEGLPGEGYTRAKTRLLDRTLVCTPPRGRQVLLKKKWAGGTGSGACSGWIEHEPAGRG